MGAPQQLLEGIQVVLTGHDDAENALSDVGVHPLLPGKLQDLRTELRERKGDREDGLEKLG